MTAKELAKDAYGLLKDTAKQWSDANAMRMGAALAYYTAFSLSPLLLLCIAIAGLVFGKEAARGRITGQIGTTVGQPVADAVQSILQHAGGFGAGMIATAVGVLTLLFGASGVFTELHDSLNTLWGVEPKPGRAVVTILRERFLSFAMVLGTGFLLLVSLVVTTALGALGDWLLPAAGPLAAAGQVVNFVASFGIITLLFALIFKFVPDVKIGWRDVWVGAALTALLFTAGKFALGEYLAHGSVASGYGAAGSLVIVLVWVYYSSLILMFGAAFTRVYADRYGSHVEPAENAVPVTPEALARQGQPRATPLGRHQHS